jgi:hypothetical protein
MLTLGTTYPDSCFLNPGVIKLEPGFALFTLNNHFYSPKKLGSIYGTKLSGLSFRKAESFA